MNIICFIAGMVLGMLGLLFMQGASKTSRDHELFTEGYTAALQENKKEIPKKPREDVLGYRCPVCDTHVWGLVSRMNYCGECGNKMEWGNDDELHD